MSSAPKRVAAASGDEQLTASAVARLKGCSPTTVSTACDEGVLPFVRVGTVRAIRRADALKWTPRPVGWKKGRLRGPRKP